MDNIHTITVRLKRYMQYIMTSAIHETHKEHTRDTPIINERHARHETDVLKGHKKHVTYTYT